MPNLSLGVAGLHGQVGAGLTPRHAANFAAALGTYVEGGTVLVARDTRYSTPMLAQAATAALLSCGCEVLDADVCPAPLAHYLASRPEVAAGLLVGGSHHPADWNALVAINAEGACFSPVQSQTILDLYHSRDYRRQPWDGLGRLRPVPPEWAAGYLDRLLAGRDVAAIRARGYTVVADFCNGSGGALVQALAERLGVRLIALNDTRSGFLPHDPEPRPRASVQVQALMAPVRAHLGATFNTDLTRMALVTCSGETLSEEYTLPLVADRVLERLGRPGLVVANVCTSRSLDHAVQARGGAVERSRVGQAYTIDRLVETRAALAGEGCGSAADPRMGPWYDGCVMLLAVLEAMAVRGATLTALAAGLRRYHLVKRKLPCPAAHAYSLVHGLREAFPDAACDDTDGLRFDWPQGWVHARVSGTEPAVRVIAEWETMAGAHEIAQKVRGLIERQLPR